MKYPFEKERRRIKLTPHKFSVTHCAHLIININLYYINVCPCVFHNEQLSIKKVDKVPISIYFIPSSILIIFIQSSVHTLYDFFVHFFVIRPFGNSSMIEYIVSIVYFRPEITFYFFLFIYHKLHFRLSII